MKYRLLAIVLMCWSAEAVAQQDGVGWSLSTGVVVPLGSPLSDIATVGPSISGEALYSVHEWISVGVALSITVPVPKEVAGERVSVPHFIQIFARSVFHGGDQFTYFGGLGVGLSYYGIPECDVVCEPTESIARFGGDVTLGVGGRITDIMSIGPSVSFVVPDFIRGDKLWYVTGNFTMQWGL
jgi:hypothetical protein